MASEEVTEFNIDNEKVEIVNDSIFLGSKIQNTGTCDGEIACRLALGRAAMSGLTKIWRSKDIGTKTKIRIVNALVFPMTRYGCESWTMRQSERKKIDSFELWCWRRLLRRPIPWTAKRTNVLILEEIKPTQSLESLIVKQKLSYFGHIMRKQNSLEKSIMLGMGEGGRRRGRPCMRWKDDIKTVTRLTR
ncbi:endonuclease-reverse transcriptase [Elysia marginata]|uniref:Endonuclease-reverse transcriptase n=1 Tax=Elysia marginata TaxID=1093978 RepID=A0AAV4HCI2_9GAST|nr:endonuclease-reverse transcriptase [Elysia marginata]